MRRLLLVVAVLAVSLAPCHAQAGDEPIVMKVASSTSGDASEKWIKSFKAGVEKRSGGRIRVLHYPNGQLGAIPSVVEGAAMGTIEVVLAPLGFLFGLEPRFRALDLAGTLSSHEHAQHTLDDPELRRRIATFGSDKNIEPLFLLATGPTMLVSSQPIERLSDFKGKKIRMPGSGMRYTEPLRRFGASPAPSLSLGEAVQAFSNKTIDGVMAGITVFTLYKYHDLSQHMIEVPHSFLISAAVANRSFLASLGPQLASVVREEATRASVHLGPDAIRDIVVARREWTSNQGRIYRLSDEDRARFRAELDGVVSAMIAEDSTLRDDYQALLDAATRQMR